MVMMKKESMLNGQHNPKSGVMRLVGLRYKTDCHIKSDAKTDL
jgi:hypothetical protein